MRVDLVEGPFLLVRPALRSRPFTSMIPVRSTTGLVNCGKLAPREVLPSAGESGLALVSRSKTTSCIESGEFTDEQSSNYCDRYGKSTAPTDAGTKLSRRGVPKRTRSKDVP